MATNQARSDDFNPRSKEVDEKIRRLLDPSIPDEVPAPKDKDPAPIIKKVEIQEADSEPTEVAEPTAPELDSSASVDASEADTEAVAIDPDLDQEQKPPIKINITDDSKTPKEV